MLKGIQINTRSVNTGLAELKMLIYKEKPDFVAMCETWLNSNSRNIPKFYNYNARWKHRPDSIGGGLGLLLKDGLQFIDVPIDPYPRGVLEYQCIRVFLDNRSSIDLFNVYNPNKNLTIAEMEYYISKLQDKFAIVGDFNAHSTVLSSRDVSNFTGRTIEKLILDSNICLINPRDLYTYLNVANCTRSCLDLCLTSPNLALCTNVSLLPEIDSDHRPLEINIITRPQICETSYRPKWKTTPENLTAFSADIEESLIIRPNSVDTLVSDFSTRIMNSATKHIERTSGKARKGKKFQKEAKQAC